MNYTDFEGGYFVAAEKLKEIGGQLYKGVGLDAATTLVSGNNCFTYWEKGSRRRQEIAALCKILGIDSYGKTGGRIARWLLKELICLPFERTFWQKPYRDLAKGGEHWHYTHVVAKEHFIGCEFDLKSAYFSSLFFGKSLLFDSSSGWINDNNALEMLKDINHFLPKWFRLQLLGCLSSWRMNYFVRNKENPQSNQLTYKTRYEITYNAAFNAAHRAILRNYKIMQQVHKIGGEHIKRMHTDSFTLALTCPEKTEIEIFNYLENKGLKVDVKNCGQAYFFDVNAGFIGRHFVGSKNDVVELMRDSQVKMKREKINPQVLDRFGEKIVNSNFMEKTEKEGINDNYDSRQLELFNQAA